MNLKFAGDLWTMAMKNDDKFEEELTCQIKIDFKELEFKEPWPEHLKIFKKCTLIGCLCLKCIVFELKKVQRSYV